MCGLVEAHTKETLSMVSGMVLVHLYVQMVVHHTRAIGKMANETERYGIPSVSILFRVVLTDSIYLLSRNIITLEQDIFKNR